jgi:ABC-type antimicrobial peptide transport system permease subunit
MRRREVGLRMALGAARSEVVRQFLFKGLWVSLVGCGTGLIFAAALGPALAGVLYGVSPFDAVTFAGVLLLIIATATAASIFPALRAARVQPMQVLREE